MDRHSASHFINSITCITNMFPKLANHIISYKISNLLKRDRDLNKLKSTPPEDTSPQVSAFLEKKIFRRIFSTYFLACKNLTPPPPQVCPTPTPRDMIWTKLNLNFLRILSHVSAFLGKWFLRRRLLEKYQFISIIQNCPPLKVWPFIWTNLKPNNVLSQI